MSKILVVLFEKCTGCGACISVCPYNALDMTYQNGEFNNLKKVKVISSKCNACAACIDSCRYTALIIRE
jgi:ferredoxin